VSECVGNFHLSNGVIVMENDKEAAVGLF
jgi:hypothetical protein